MSELKSCPFCGSPADLYQNTANSEWNVCCANETTDETCILAGLDWDFSNASKEEVIAAWNTRAQPLKPGVI